MNRTSPGQPPISRGFTLLEIMVVMLLIGIMTTWTVLNLRGGTGSEQHQEARRLKALMQLAQEEAVIRGIEIGVRVEPEGYSFMLYDGQRWLPLLEDEILRPRQLDEELELYLKVEGQESLLRNADEDEEDPEAEDGKGPAAKAKKIKPPQIYFLSSGETNEFRLAVGATDPDADAFYRIHGHYNGNLVVEGPINGHYQQDIERDWQKD